MPMTRQTPWRLPRGVAPLLMFFLLLAGTSARADRVKGHLTFLDQVGTGYPRFINDCKVEIWRSTVGSAWSMDRSVRTDSTGWIDVQLPYLGSETRYRVRVYAANTYVTVWPQDTIPTIHSDPWYNDLPEQSSFGPDDVIDVTHYYTWSVAAQNFNLARTLWFAGEYMKQKYPGTNLSTVNAQIDSILSTSSFYDPFLDFIHIRPNQAFWDHSIAHEYGHFVQEQIGSFPVDEAKHHEMCTPSNSILGWMEGFADYFASAVSRAFPGELHGTHTFLEDGACANVPKNERYKTEYFVAATLWDLIDDGTGPDANWSKPEAHDWVSNKDELILSIVANELRVIPKPTITDFRNAWIGRYQSARNLDRILASVGIGEHFNLAEVAHVSVPSRMAPGGVYAVQVVMFNPGSTIWSAGAGYALGSQSPQDNLTWGLHRVNLSGDIEPGQSATFDFYAKAPSKSGFYAFQWKMVRDGVEWFGDATSPTQVLVANDQDAQFISQSVPDSMQAGSGHAVSVTMKNLGTTTWTPGNYFLGSQNPQDNSTWGLNRVALPYAIGPGGEVTFTFMVTAPASSGGYNFQWRMLQNSVGWFGESTENFGVGVTAPGPTCTASACNSQCHAEGCSRGVCDPDGVCQCTRCP